MYRDLLDKFNTEIDFENYNSQQIKPVDSGLIDPRRKQDAKVEEYDPTSLMKEWMKIIKTSGEQYRKKAIAQNEEALSKMSEPVLPPKEEPVEKVLPEETPQEIGKRKVASLFDGVDLEEDEGFVLPRYRGNNGEVVSLARTAAAQAGVPEDLYLRLVQQESGFNTSAKSPKGAIGPAQLMPATARKLGVNPYNTVENLEGGARYLREQYNEFGRWDLALAAYNAGPGAVQKHGGIPPYKETQNYVRSILD